VTLTAGLGQLEINQYMPLLAHSLLESLRLLRDASAVFADKCIVGITADEERCEELVAKSQALATVLVPALGYETVARLLAASRQAGRTLAAHMAAVGVLSEADAAGLLAPKRMRKLGFEEEDYECLRRPKG